MEKKYVVVGFGVNQQGKEYSRCYAVKSGKKKESGEPFGFLDSKEVFYTQDLRELGSVITVESYLV